MTLQEIIKKCEEEIARSGEKADILLLIPGKWGKTNKRKLFKIKGAPVGEIVCDNFGKGLHVMFNATEVKKFIIKQVLNDL
jgi:hypothetical protein